MSKNKQTLAERNAKICDEVITLLIEKSPRGIQKYATQYIFDMVGEEHDLQTKTISNIFWSSHQYGETVSGNAG